MKTMNCRSIITIKTVLCGFLYGLFLTGLWSESIVNSVHNLSALGPGNVKATTESQICIFCHTPHSASSDAPLWNRYSSGSVYLPYTSSTMVASVGQPTGASKLCLSCHDGTVALGMVRNRINEISIAGGDLMPAGNSNLGTDLGDDHPVSFTYDTTLQATRGELNAPTGLDGAVLLENGQMQCTSCHDPHDNQFGDFLVQSNDASALCRMCHDKDYWTFSRHRTSGATWNGSGGDPWPHTDATTVSDNACENCHRPHTAGMSERLLNFSNEEDNCLRCHNGNVAADDILADFNKASRHPITQTDWIHDPTEDLVNPTRHVECVDCHNPHASNSQSGTAPDASGSLMGVAGITSSGAPVDPLQYEYELCFRCHADSIQKGSALVPRQIVETNTRLEFDPANASFHPVVAPGASNSVPSLVSPWTTSSMMYCTDCHNSDNTAGPGGPGANGPHGSTWEPILERQLVLTDYQNESSAIYAMCYKCHSRTSILNDRSFTYHNKHINEQTACTTCHDPHGVADATHLINFNTDYVFPNSNGILEFIDLGNREGSCSLDCHGENHRNATYAP